MLQELFLKISVYIGKGIFFFLIDVKYLQCFCNILFLYCYIFLFFMMSKNVDNEVKIVEN